MRKPFEYMDLGVFGRWWLADEEGRWMLRCPRIDTYTIGSRIQCRRNRTHGGASIFLQLVRMDRHVGAEGLVLRLHDFEVFGNNHSRRLEKLPELIRERATDALVGFRFDQWMARLDLCNG